MAIYGLIVLQASIGQWLHTAEVCFHHEGGDMAVSQLLNQREKEQGWAVWSVIPPFRGHNLIPAFVATLKHYIVYHTRVSLSMITQG